MKPVFVAIGAFALSMAAASAGAVEVPVQQNYAAVATDLDKSGKLFVVAWLYPVQGSTAVCGLYFPDRAGSEYKSRKSKLLDNLKFSLNGKNLNVPASSFTEYGSEDEAKAGGKGRCVASKIAWNDSHAQVKVDIGIKGRTLRD